MKFGQVDQPGRIDFSLPEDHPDTAATLSETGDREPTEIYVGCAKWNRKDLKGFYPRGTKDELTYYATQFNAIELNATFYRSPDKQQVITWASKTPEGFKFFPKIPGYISHQKWLNGVTSFVSEFCDAVSAFEEKLGMVFLQMNNNFKPKYMDRLVEFVENFPAYIPLAVELRSPDWFADREAFNSYTQLLKEQNRTNVIVDTAGRRDMLHMRLTSESAFVRYVGANHKSDYSRLDDWVERIAKWRSQGLRNLYFFVHQNVERESPRLSAYFIHKINEACGLSLTPPVSAQTALGL